MFPLDIASGWPADYRGPGPRRGPWMVEVKRVAALDASSRGWTGEAFIRHALSKVAGASFAVNRTSGGAPMVPALFARGEGPWQVWVMSSAMLGAYGSETTSATGWTCLDPATFFADIARSLLDSVA